MPEHIRALFVILALAALVFTLARRPAADLIPFHDFTRRRNLWLALTILAFISHNFWLFAGVATIVLSLARRRERNPLALFFFVLFLIPPVPVAIPGLGLITYLFKLDYIRLLALCILLPAFFTLRKQADTLRFGSTWPDKLLGTYLLLTSLLYLRETTLTDSLRQSLYLLTDVFLPYYVASRALKKISDFRDALLALVLAAMLLALIGLFEFTRHWLLYRALVGALGLNWDIAGYLSRGGSLRAIATTGQAIALGFVLSVAIGFYLFLQARIRSRLHRRLGVLLLAAGLFAPLSRGPWIGAAAMLVTFIATGQKAATRLSFLAFAAILSLPLLGILPGGQKILNLLPFIGNVDNANITYRERLFDNAMIVIQRNPWLGSIDYLKTPEMQSMIQGQGIIDIVNSYLRIALESGLVGLALFTGFFAVILFGTIKVIRTFANKDDEMPRLGRALLATLVGILITISTVSSITVIPILYWSVAGVGVAYIQMARRAKHAQSTNPATLAQAALA